MPLLRLFRMVALAEGVSTLLLFLVAMPLKYMFDQPGLIRPVGWAHGVLFLSYIVAMVPGLWGRKAGLLGWLRTFIAALFPFGTFLNDGFLKRLER
ncbi:membrane protein [Erythrobacter sp. SG61-1L]|nr:membrane protein [Erythrobacter sp. SG61-1L]